MDYARVEQAGRWFVHPVLGEASFDTFERMAYNPIFEGMGIWKWPVNGSLFIDPVSSHWYVYVSLYTEGYLPTSGTVVAVRSTDGGESWEHIGPVFDMTGLAASFRASCALESSVVFDNGIYHMIYSWATEDLHTNGGIAYARADRPEGPFRRAEQPITHDTDPSTHASMTYVRSYAATLLKRDNDWLILTDLSTQGNKGIIWAMAALTAPTAEGPYTRPVPVLDPRSERYLPAPLEYFPAFVKDEYVYAPATPISTNRSVQYLFRAKLEDAHLPEAWSLFREGSNWHGEANDYEHQGIWGQTLAGQVIGNELWVMYPALNERNEGTINMARRSWDNPESDGFAVTANGASSLTFLPELRSEYTLQMSCLPTGQARFTIHWGWNDPIGVHHDPMWSCPHPLSMKSGSRLSFEGKEWTWVGSNGEILSQGRLSENSRVRIAINQETDRCRITINDLTAEAMQKTVPGRIGLSCGPHSFLCVDKFELNGRTKALWLDLLPTEALMHAGQETGTWDWEENDSAYRFGCGYRSTTREGRLSSDGVRLAKWIFKGTAFRLWQPVKGRGVIRIELDGELLEEVELIPDNTPSARMVLERHGLAEGRHTLKATLLEGEMCCDSLSFL